MLFQEVIGHQELKEKLAERVLENRIAHAQMITGAPGTAMFPLALAFARFLLCTDKQGKDACGTCPSCVKVNALQHPDLHFSYPTINPGSGKKNVADTFGEAWREMISDSPYISQEDWRHYIGAENKQLNLGTDEAENILKKLSLSSYGGGYKIMVIWLPEKMNTSAANKLLKLFEEPNPKTLFLLVCEDTELLLSTIISRMQTIKVTPIDEEELKKALMVRFHVTEDEADQITSFADGDINLALRLINSDAESDYFKMLVDWMRACYNYDVQKLVPLSDDFHGSGRENQKSFYEYALHFIRQCLVSNYGQENLAKFTPEEAKFASKFSPFINHLNVMDLVDTIEKAHRDITRNCYGKIVMLHTSYLVHKLLRRTA